MENSKSGLANIARHRSELSFTLGNEVEDIAPVTEEIANLLARHWAESSGRSRKVVMALQEAISNAVLHGNLGLSSSLRENGSDAFFRLAEVRRMQQPWCARIVRVQCSVSLRTAKIVVADQGEGFDPASVRSCVDGSGIYKMSGRGIAVMEALMDEVVFSNGGRTVTLTVHRASDE